MAKHMHLILEALEPRWLPAPTQLVFTTAAQTLTAGQNSAVITIQLEDQTGKAALASVDVTFTLSTTSTAGSFLDTGGQPLSGNSLTIAAGSSSAGFEYLDANGGTPTLKAAGDGFSATQQETVNAAAAEQIAMRASFDGSNGAHPQAGLVMDSSGDLFGTTIYNGGVLSGTVFEVAQGSNTITTLAAFDGSNGAAPETGLVMDSSGDLFGTTSAGGGPNNDGTVFEVASGSNTITTLAVFDGSNGAAPEGGLVMDSSGGLFGATEAGGPNAIGTVFEVAHGSNIITTLAVFDRSNGAAPFGGVVMNNNGDLFGVTLGGGPNGDGTVFELAHGSNTITTLASFDGSNGSEPVRGLVMNTSGDLFGTTEYGGPSNDGTVFEVTHGSNTITTLAVFDGSNGANPIEGLVMNSSGDLFGTTLVGGPNNAGTLFEVTHGSNTFTMLAAFDVSNGAAPFDGLVMNSSGDLFGTTYYGGPNNDGTVFELPSSPSLHLAFTTPAQTLEVGVASSIGVQLKNPAGISVSPNVPVTVNLSSSSSGGVFFSGGQPITSVTILPGGISSASFQYEDTVAGMPTLTASATGFTSAQQQETIVTDHLSISAPARVSMNAPFSVTVSAVDQFGNVDLGYSGPASLALSAAPPGGKLSGKLVGQFTAGQATFPGLSLNLLGSYTLFAAGSGPFLSGTAQIDVTGVTHFGVTLSGVPAGGLVAGQPVMATVATLDNTGAVVSGYTGTIHFTSSDPLAGLPANYTFTTGTGGDNGSHTFTIPLESAGMQTITATSTAQPKLTGTSPPVLVIAAALDHLLITGYPKTDISGQAHSATVQAVDAFNNPVTSYTGTVTLSSSDSAALGLPASFTITAGDAGSHSFTGVILTTAGNQSLSAQDTAQNLSSSPYTVKVVSPATRLAVSGPASVVAGTAFTITVKALAGSVVDTQFTDTVGFSSSDPYAGPYLPGNTAFTKSDKGSKQFTITLILAGTETVTVTDLTRGSVKPAVLTVQVDPGDPIGFSVSYVTGDVAGTAHNLTVKATDAHGNLVPSYTGTIQLTSSDSQTKGLPTSFTFTPSNHGIHTFSGVILNTVTGSTSNPATQVIVQDTTHGLSGEAQIPVQSPATALAVSGPATAVAGQAFTITVKALAGTKIDSQFPDTVGFSTSDRQAQAGLPASSTLGSGKFTITLLTAGRQTVTIADVTRGRITRAVFTIVVSPASFSQLGVSGYPATTLLGASHPFLVRAEDAYGNVVPGYTGIVKLVSTDSTTTGLPASYTFKATDKGVHPFSVAFHTVGAWKLEATDSVNTSITGSLAVNAANLTAGVTPPASIVRGQTVDFTLSASEDGATSATVFTWLVDWNGDGKIDQTFTGAAGQTSITVSHIFAAMGTDSVKVAVKDPSGNVSPQPATTTVQVVPLALESEADGTTDLVIGGTTGKDVILIQAVNDQSGQTVWVRINGMVQTIGGQTAFSPTGHIVVYGQGGGDTILVQSNTIGGKTVEVAIPAVLFSGGGNSTLSVAGSSAANVLVGGPGNDRLTGGSGADILTGGAGKDILQAGLGSDLLINGSTIYDANLAALLALSSEWGSGDSYQTRVQDLYYGGAGAINGNYLLNAHAVTPDRVSNSNQLFGSPGGLDWFWLAAGIDKLRGEATGEVATLD
jgi:uncharacterized repeat protein (TIGR03803 family)